MSLARLIASIQQCAQDFMGLRTFISKSDSSLVPVDLKKLETMQGMVVSL